MLTVPEPVIQKTQAQLFAFLWRNKKDKVKRQIIYQTKSNGVLNFMNFRTMVKSNPEGHIYSLANKHLRLTSLTELDWQIS